VNEDIEYGREVIRHEAEAVRHLGDLLDERFHDAVELILGCAGHVVATGMGKSGIIAQKVSATLASTGTPSFFLHPADALHGDMGRIGNEDLVLAISNSGLADEIRRLIPGVKRIGATLIAITSNGSSPLAEHADCVLDCGSAPEACPLRLAPTTSTTAQLALGDALAMTVSKRRNLTREEYARFHPAGELGRSLLKVADVMTEVGPGAAARLGTQTRDALVEAEQFGRRPGALAVVAPDGTLRGILTDGDLRRHLLRNPSFVERPIEAVMTPDPLSIRADQLAADAWRMMRDRRFDELPVVDADGKYLGLLDVQDLLKAGFTEGA